MRKRIISLILAVLTLVGLLAGCGGEAEPSESESVSSSQSESESEGPFDPANVTVAVCMGQINHPVHRIVQMAFVTKAKELGYNAIVSGLDEGSLQELRTKFESAITNGARGCLVWCADDSMYEFMRNQSAVCHFVVPHFAHSYADTKSFIARNISCLPAAYGAKAADYIVDKLAEKGVTSGVLGITQAGPNVTENAASDAFIAEIERLGVDFTCADVVHEGLEVVSAANKVTGLIQSHPDIVGGFGTTGGSCQSWTLAMENTGKQDLVVVGVDYTEINLDYVDAGAISAIVAQPLFEEAQESAATLDAIFRGTDFTAAEDQWFLELEAPLACTGGEDKSDITYYRPLIEQVKAYFSD